MTTRSDGVASTFFQVRLTPGEHDTLRANAEARGESMADYVRRSTIEAPCTTKKCGAAA